MKELKPQLKFFINLAQLQAKVSQIFDRHLLGGLSFNDFIILYYLSQVEDERLRRIDLADKLGVTPSGITRMLLPMEKLGMVTREASEYDARVSFVKLAPGGKRLLNETIEEAEHMAEEILPETKLASKEIGDIFSSFTIRNSW